MPCENASFCSAAADITSVTTFVVTSPLSLTNPDNDTSHSTSPTTTQRGSPVSLDRAEVTFTLSLSLLTVACNLLALFLTRFAGGGQSPTMVFVRTLCVSDFLVGCYGVGKMVMFLFVDGLHINFFLPESLLFTATTAACLSLLLLNVDRSVKISAPFWYAQHIDKPSIITGMVFLWNVSFVLGFLPLLGWNSNRKGYVYGFFQFHPWHYLLVMGLLWLACVSGSVAILLYVRGRVDLALPVPRPLTRHLTEVEKYCQMRVTVAVDIVTWTLCYLPFLIFLGLVCDACPLGGQADPDRNVYHFVPVLMLRSLAGSGVQVYRTVHVQGLAKLRRGSGSITSPDHHHHRHRRRRYFHKRLFEENGVATISYSNPVCENSLTEVSALDDCVVCSVPTLLEAAAGSDEGGRGGQGIANPAYRPSIQIDSAPDMGGLTDENTAL